MSAAQATGSTYFNPPAPCGAGHQAAYETAMETDFNPPAPCGAGLEPRYRVPYIQPISIHPPLAGRDLWDYADQTKLFYFNPPAPCGAGPRFRADPRSGKYFNPPAPCGAGPRRPEIKASLGHFNPPAPCGAGHDLAVIKPRQLPFQSTRPLRGGTASGPAPPMIQRFQSTRPLRGGTAILHKKTVQNIAYCTKSAFTLAVLSGFPALMRPFFCQTCTNFGANLPKNRCSLPVRTLIPSGPPPADSRH